MGAPAPSPNGSAPHAAPSRGAVSWLLRAVPTALVLAGLAGAAYWGHATGWDFPPRTGDARPPADTPPAGGDRPVVRIEAAAPGAGSPLPGLGVRVEFASARAVEAAGIDITPAWPAPLTEQVAAAGEVRFDPGRVARIAARAGGVARRVYKTAGDPVPVLTWLDYKFKPLATKTLPPTHGEWRTAELAVRRGPDPIMFSLYNTALGAEHTLHVRAAELWPGPVPAKPTD